MSLHQEHTPSSETSRHRHIENTMKYIQLVQFKDYEFDVATGTTVDEAKELIGASFEYITEKTCMHARSSNREELLQCKL